MDHEGKYPVSTSRTLFFIAAIRIAKKKGLEPLHLRRTARCASRGLWHTFGENSSVRKKKHFGQSSQREGFSSNMASVERSLELMGLKSREEVGGKYPTK